MRQCQNADHRPPSGAHSIAATAAAAVTALFVLAACSAAPSTGHASPVARAPGKPAWLLTRSALSQLMTDSTARNRLEHSRVYEILRLGQQPLAGVAAEPVITFASATALEKAVEEGRAPAGTYGVIYDPEAWPFTPISEQLDPVRAASRAAAVAHAHGLRLIAAPALNLTKILTPANRAPRWQQFLHLNLVGQMARIADVVELQAQSLERDTATYTAFVRAASSQATAANPKIMILAGLSTNPPGPPVNSKHLTDAIDATRPTVGGYWLNIPGAGPRCLTCNQPRPYIAIQTLQNLH